jgi:Cu-Zn family superoxide dismutase
MGRRKTWFASALAAAFALSAPAFAADKATAVLKDADGKEVGKVTLIAVPTGVLLDADFTAVPPGDHAFHIHAEGKCEPPDFKSAGGHFNPEEDKHGLMNEAGPHAGDMPNIHVPENGKLHIEVLNQRVFLSDGLLDDDGSAIVIHQGPDDYKSDPAGNAGPRIACGVITQ